jgi:hypothetical protein
LTAILRLSAVLAAFALIGATSARAAEDRTSYVPDGLTQTVTTTHFMLHYSPSTPSPEAGMSMAQYVNAGANDFEESYGRLVIGGGGSPNAGLRAPTADSDGKTDVYLAAPKNKPGFGGGIVYRDSYPSRSSYMFMTPDLGRSGFRFRSAHEFMHVIQGAYAFGYADGLQEGFANWASEFALPDIDPMDNNWDFAFVPLDCTASDCGQGYWQWMFIQAQVEDYGPDFVSGYYERYAPLYLTFPKIAWLLGEEIKAQTGGAESLSTRFAAYARDIWEPARWTTGSVAALWATGIPPRGTLFGFGNVDGADSGWRAVTIDHLAVRYVRIRNVASPGSSGTIGIEWTRPAGMAAAMVPLVKHASDRRWYDGGSFPGATGSLQIGVSGDVSEIVLPLVNDSLTAGGQAFGYRIRYTEPPAPPEPARAALSGFRVSPSRFRLGRGAPKMAKKIPVGTTLRFTLSAPARVTFTFTRVVRTRNGRHTVRGGSFTVSAKAGTNKVKFMGRVSKRRALKPGKWTVRAQGRDSTGRSTTAGTAHFTLLPR